MKTHPLHTLLLFALFLSFLSVTTGGTDKDSPAQDPGYWQRLGEKLSERIDQLRQPSLDDGLD